MQYNTNFNTKEISVNALGIELTEELLDDETFDVDTNCNAENDEATVLSQAEHGNGNDIMEDVVEEKELSWEDGCQHSGWWKHEWKCKWFLCWYGMEWTDENKDWHVCPECGK